MTSCRTGQSNALGARSVLDGLKTMTPEQKKANLKTGLILASVAVVFFIGFMVKMIVLSR